jgi:MYXO-CTERM domain-containing protein
MRPFPSVGVAALVALAAVVGCSSSSTSSDPSERPATASQAIQGGAVDTSDSYTVGLCINRQTSGGQTFCAYTCSGALIAPNLIVTARHCIQQAPETIDCATSQFGAQLGTVSITPDTVIDSATHWFPVKTTGGIVTPIPKGVCGNDIALLTLTSNVPSSLATPIIPVVQYPMTNHNLYSFYEDAIGYGITAVGANDSGTRRIKKDVKIECIPGDAQRDCGDLTGSGLTANEFITGDATCSGDSGSSAIEHNSRLANAPASLGVLSRGGQDGTVCKYGIYTRLDVYHDLIVATVKTAAPLGGYAVPSWTQPAPPEPPDGGAPKTDGGPSAPQPGELGAKCAKDSECTSKTCVSSGGDTFVCADVCDPKASTSTCADGYHCVAAGDTGYCFAGPPGDGANKTTTTTTNGCSVGPAPRDPTKPVPWRALGVVAVIGLAFAGRRRRTH